MVWFKERVVLSLEEWDTVRKVLYKQKMLMKAQLRQSYLSSLLKEKKYKLCISLFYCIFLMNYEFRRKNNKVIEDLKKKEKE